MVFRITQNLKNTILLPHFNILLLENMIKILASQLTQVYANVSIAPALDSYAALRCLTPLILLNFPINICYPKELQNSSSFDATAGKLGEENPEIVKQIIFHQHAIIYTNKSAEQYIPNEKSNTLPFIK